MGSSAQATTAPERLAVCLEVCRQFGQKLEKKDLAAQHLNANMFGDMRIQTQPT